MCQQPQPAANARRISRPHSKLNRLCEAAASCGGFLTTFAEVAKALGLTPSRVTQMFGYGQETAGTVVRAETVGRIVGAFTGDGVPCEIDWLYQEFDVFPRRWLGLDRRRRLPRLPRWVLGLRGGLPARRVSPQERPVEPQRLHRLSLCPSPPVSERSGVGVPAGRRRAIARSAAPAGLRAPPTSRSARRVANAESRGRSPLVDFLVLAPVPDRPSVRVASQGRECDFHTKQGMNGIAVRIRCSPPRRVRR
jgi:hypothetical protein